MAYESSIRDYLGSPKAKIMAMQNPSTLIVGYGNLDRQDDGVSWHMMAELATRLGRPIPDDTIGFQPDGSNPDFLFVLQLTPELAELITQYDRVCFLDAHTGNIEEDISFRTPEPGFQRSPFTHHMTAETLLGLSRALYGKEPTSILVSVRGHEFEFIQELSSKTSTLAHQAAKQIMAWIMGTS
jgi:hydrogenase maturation protease